MFGYSVDVDRVRYFSVALLPKPVDRSAKMGDVVRLLSMSTAQQEGIQFCVPFFF